MFLLAGGILLDLELGSLHDKVHATVDTDCIVERQEVKSIFLVVGPGNVVGDDAPQGSGHSNGSELGEVLFVLV